MPVQVREDVKLLEPLKERVHGSGHARDQIVRVIVYGHDPARKKVLATEH
jgi:hypothetical protein